MQKWVHLTLADGKVITATEGYPFRTADGWRDAILLKQGDTLILTGSDGKPATIQIDGIRYETKVLTTYNLEVANAHTFFVGQLQYSPNSLGIPAWKLDLAKNATGMTATGVVKMDEGIGNPICGCQ